MTPVLPPPPRRNVDLRQERPVVTRILDRRADESRKVAIGRSDCSNPPIVNQRPHRFSGGEDTLEMLPVSGCFANEVEVGLSIQ